MEEITILDSQAGPVMLATGVSYKLINPDGEDIGGFVLSGTPLVPSNDDGLIFLTGVPYTGQLLFVDVNDKGGSLTKIANRGSEKIHAFAVLHPDISYKDQDFRPFHSTVQKPKPFQVVWSYFDPASEKDVEVTVSIKPVPAEHAIVVSFTTSE